MRDLRAPIMRPRWRRETPACSALPTSTPETLPRWPTTDVAIIFWRRMMMRMARNLDKGIEPAILSDPNLFRAIPLQTTAPESDFGNLWAAHHDAYRREPALA